VSEIFLVGDIHGCFEEFMDLLEHAGFSLSRHKLYLVGDLINKGPKSLQTLTWVRDNQIPSVIGNHELRFLEGIIQKKSLSPQMKELADQMGSELENWLAWIDNLPKYIETNEFFIVHGGLIPGEHPSQSDSQYLATLRTWTGKLTQQYFPEAPPWHNFYDGDKFVYYGHFAAQGVHRTKNTLCLDSGCVYGRSLSGTWHQSHDVISIPARKTYCQIRASQNSLK
jgi:hypothetical protein